MWRDLWLVLSGRDSLRAAYERGRAAASVADVVEMVSPTRTPFVDQFLALKEWPAAPPPARLDEFESRGRL